MTATTDRPVSPVHPSFRGLMPVLLVAAPLLMALARLLLVPMNNDDLDQTMTDMAAAHVRSDAGWLLAMLSCGLLALTAVDLAQRVAAGGRTRSAAVALVGTAVGWVGCAAICMGGLVMSAAGRLPGRAAQVTLQENLDSGTTGFVFLMVVAGAVGYVVMAVALARSGQSSKGASVLLGLGGAGTLMTMPGPVTALLVLAALLLLAGYVLSRSPR